MSNRKQCVCSHNLGLRKEQKNMSVPLERGVRTKSWTDYVKKRACEKISVITDLL